MNNAKKKAQEDAISDSEFMEKYEKLLTFQLLDLLFKVF
jgi:hypothetical protein